MAYNHDGDLPEDYDFLAMVRRLSHPERRQSLHEVAETESFLNAIGHVSVLAGLRRIYDGVDVGLADLGATLYEAATSIQFVGGDKAGTPTYHDSNGSQVALVTAYTMDRYDEFEMLELTGAAVAILDEDVSGLSDLLACVCHEVVNNEVSRADIQRVKTGAALMRTLHITAQLQT